MWNCVELCGIMSLVLILRDSSRNSKSQVRLNLVRRVYNCRMLSQWMPSGEIIYFPVQECDLATNYLQNRYVKL